MNHQIYAEASDWLVEFRTEAVDAASRRRFQTWLEGSPEHVRAYLELTSLWEVVSADDPGDATSVEALIARAQTAGNVVALDGKVPKESIGEPPDVATTLRSRLLFKPFFAVAASVTILAVVVGTALFIQRDTFSTAVGEQRSILLADGSTVELNARSSVRIRFNDRQRSIELVGGQALFDVAKDKNRPFTVRSNQTKIRAIGTRFDVNQRKSGTIVTVVEGTVSIDNAVDTERERSSSHSSSPAVMLTAGERAVLSAGTAPRPQRTDVTTATAWTQRRLIFDSTPLDEVAEEFNRNNTRPLVIEGAGLEDFHVSGAFSSSDPQPLLRFLRAQTGIEIGERADKIVVSRRR